MTVLVTAVGESGAQDGWVGPAHRAPLVTGPAVLVRPSEEVHAASARLAHGDAAPS